MTVDDAAIALVHFANGAIGTIEATRMARGRKNYNRFEINGSEGSIAFNLERMNELEVYFATDPPPMRGFRTIMVTEASHPYIRPGGRPGTSSATSTHSRTPSSTCSTRSAEQGRRARTSRTGCGTSACWTRSSARAASRRWVKVKV